MDSHSMGVRELDLSACHVNSFSNKINSVPGLRTSTAFFTFLRANLVLSPSAMSSCANTPILEASSTSMPVPMSHRPSSPSPLAANPPLTPIDDIPPLSLEPLDSQEDKVEGLHLVADSVAQMRQRASKAVVYHPLCLAGLGISLAATYRFSRGDLGLGIMLACGVTMSYLLAIRYFTGGYVQLAEQMHWSWLRSPDTGEEDIIIGARLNDPDDEQEPIIGSLVLRLQPSPVASNGSKKKARGVRGGRGIIRAWTTRMGHRGNGIGGDLLLAAVRMTKEKCGQGAEVGFAKEHANSTMLLPNMFNGPFRRDEVRATKALDGALAEWEVSKRKR